MGITDDKAPFLTERLQGFGTTIFTAMSALAAETGAVNLGQGFPDTDGPDVVAESAIAAIRAGHNQYPPLAGLPVLREAIAHHRRHHRGQTFEPDGEILVTTGATEALAASLLALTGPGDEVVTFEPYYDSYAAGIAMSGARRRVVTLRGHEFAFDPAEFEAAFTLRTKVLLLNTPHNPTGKVFTRAELETIARVCIERDVVVVTDEVYEHLVYAGHEHIPLATLPGMAERTVTISSAGKIFSFTGWKIGWACGPEPLISAVRTAKQFLTFASGGPWQHAVATGLRLGDDFFEGYTAEMADKRERLCHGLESAGFDTIRPQGTYFATVDIRSVGATDGIDFCMSLPKTAGVVAVPSQVFYDNEDEGRHFVRFAFCKKDDVLDEAVRRLHEAGAVLMLRVAAIQHDIVWEKPDENFAAVTPLIEAAVDDGANMVVLAEMWSTGFSMNSVEIAERPDGPTATFMAETAARTGSWVVGSFPEHTDGHERPTNRLLMAGPEGEDHRYSKIHPFTFAREHEHYDAGDDRLTVEVEGVRVTPLICYDLRFTDLFWDPAPMTDCYIVPANWPSVRREHWTTLLRARAIENQAYVVGVNRIGSAGRLDYSGDTSIIDPLGEVLAAPVGEVATIVADVDPAEVARVRAEFPFMQDRGNG